MSKPIFTTDLGIISPKTVAPAASKPAADMSASADAFEGALSTAVARQRENEARAQQADRAQAERDDQNRADRNQAASTDRSKSVARSKERDATRSQEDRASKSDQSDAEAASTSAAQKNATASSADAAKKAPSAEKKSVANAEKNSAAPEAVDDAAVADASTDADPTAAIAKIDADGATQDGADGETAKEQATTTAASPAADSPTVVIAVQAAPSTLEAAAAELESQAIAAAPVDGAAPTAPPLAPAPPPPVEGAAGASLTPPSAAPAAGDPLTAATPAAPAVNDLMAAAAPASDAPTTAADPSATLTAPVASAPPQSAEVAAAAPPQASAQQAISTPTETAADQALAARIAAEAALAQASAQQAAAAPTTTPAQASAPQAAKPFIPAESSSVASLKDAIDMPTTVTYTASNSSQSQNGGSAGFGAQSGFNFGSGGNPDGSAGRPAATPAIVTQDLALLSQTVTADAEALPVAEPVALVASASDDAPLVDVKPAGAQSSSPVGQSAAAHTNFEAPTAQNAAPGARAHQVLLPLASQITAGMSALAKNGGGEINIHLQPANLGRVDVSMKIDEDGRMTATITADRQDTLDLLRRDSYALERSLADAGMKTDGGGLQFSLRGESGQRDREGGGDGRAPRGLAQIAPDQEATQASPTRRTSGLSRLDMRI